MKPATSPVIKEKDQKDTCIYCGGALSKKWERKIENGLERKIKKCENGHVIRKKVKKNLSVKQLTRAHVLDRSHSS